jgi:aldose 1-epimerase
VTLQQQLRIDAESYTPADETLIPTGTIEPVAGTPLDFRKGTAIGSRIDTADEQLQRAGGYDHNYVISGKAGELREAAYAVDTSSGRSLKVLTTEPGVQFYSANNLDGSLKGYSGVAYRKYGGFCLEAQHFPDSPHHPNVPSPVLQPGETFHSVTEFVFGVEKN